MAMEGDWFSSTICYIAEYHTIKVCVTIAIAIAISENKKSLLEKFPIV